MTAGVGRIETMTVAGDNPLGDGSVALLDFNPWMFSGAEQLVESFFVELSAELKLSPDLAGVGEDLASYGEAFAGLGWLRRF